MDMHVQKECMAFDLTKAQTRDGRPYLRMVLADQEGNVYNAIMFDSNKLTFDPEKGSVMMVTGSLQVYNGQTQFKVTNMTPVENADPSKYLPRSKYDEDEMMAELSAILKEHITTPYLAALVDAFLNDEETIIRFKKIPAAKHVHHAYIGGLLEHTLSILRLSVLVSGYYGKVVDREMLLLGALFHDMGKVRELDASSGFDYTSEGKLLGHLLLGIEMLNRYISQIDGFPEMKRQLIGHLIASHHGILEYGSPKKPKTIEALILHFIDDMDAKINTFQSIFDRENVNEMGWSSYDRLLERQIFRYIPEQ